MSEKKFTMIDESFVCDECGAIVEKLNYTARDHCNNCLCSKHLDIMPGDRRANCGGTLRPIAIEKGSKDKLKIVINIASTDGIDTYSSLNIDYSASKAGLINLTKSLALTLPNIKILAICPNWVETESIKEMNQEYLKQEMKRINQKQLIKPDEISKKIINIINSDIKSGEIIVMRDSNE